MKREIKIWGERWLIRQDSTHAISFLKLWENYRCSWHKHDTKYNLFMILEGQVGIRVQELGHIREVILTEGDTFTVKPGQWHEFRIYQNASAIEEMYVEYCEQDIQRTVLGSSLYKDQTNVL